MGKISNYVRVLKAKLQDVFVIDSTDSNVTTTKSVTVEQIGDAICGEQVHSDLKTDNQTIIGGINENKDKVGDLSQLTTSEKSSLVGAVNEVNEKATSFIYTDSTVTNFIDLFASIPNNKTIGFLLNSGTVSNCPVPYPMGIIAKLNSSTAFIVLTQLNGTDATYIGRIISGVLTWRKITTSA